MFEERYGALCRALKAPPDLAEAVTERAQPAKRHLLRPALIAAALAVAVTAGALAADCIAGVSVRKRGKPAPEDLRAIFGTLAEDEEFLEEIKGKEVVTISLEPGFYPLEEEAAAALRDRVENGGDGKSTTFLTVGQAEARYGISLLRLRDAGRDTDICVLEGRCTETPRESAGYWASIYWDTQAEGFTAHFRATLILEGEQDYPIGGASLSDDSFDETEVCHIEALDTDAQLVTSRGSAEIDGKKIDFSSTTAVFVRDHISYMITVHSLGGKDAAAEVRELLEQLS